MRNRILVLSLFVFLASCAMSETRIYSLYLPNPSAPSLTAGDTKGASGGTNGKDNAAVIVLVSSPKYLSQPYIALRSSPYQLTVSRYSKWDSSPDEIVQSALKQSLCRGLFKEVRISHTVPTGFYSLKIDLKKFERSDEGALAYGEVAFEVNLISPDGKNLYEKNIVKRTQLADRSFVSLAKGLSSILGEGVDEVRGDIEKTVSH